MDAQAAVGLRTRTGEARLVRGWDAEIAVEQGLEVADQVTKRGMTVLHQGGWSLRRLFEEPKAMLPVAPSRRGPGRVYLFSDAAALVIVQRSGKVEVVLRAEDALQALHADSPDVLQANPWASQRWARLGGAKVACVNRLNP